jgi:sterol desaturase/sphingolipid hydroxylase (fatty acid hydroxylase superfamily)
MNGHLPDPAALAIPFFTLAGLLEVVVARVRGRGHWSLRDAGTSLLTGFGFMVVNLLSAGVIYAAYLWLHRFRLFDLPISFWAWAVLLPLEDLCAYWNHRWSHEWRLWWASHATHHSSRAFNLATGLRQTWTDPLTLGWLCWAPLVLLGFHPALVLFQRGLSLVYAFFLHTVHVPRGPDWLERNLGTPSNHRVHHASNPRYLDANYAPICQFWDRLFGTYVAETPEEPVRFGLVHDIATENPLRVLLFEWAWMWRDVRRAPDWRSRLRYVFGRVGWSHDGSKRTTAEAKAAWRRWREQQSRQADAPQAPRPAPTATQAAPAAGALALLLLLAPGPDAQAEPCPTPSDAHAPGAPAGGEARPAWLPARVGSPDRLAPARERLRQEGAHAATWAGVWGAVNGAFLVGNLAALPFTPPDAASRAPRVVGAAQAALGLAGVLLAPPGVRAEADALEASLAALPAGGCAAVAEADLRLERGAWAEAESTGWLPHALNLAVNAGAGLVLWLGYGRPVDALFAGVGGAALGTASILTRPRGLLGAAAPAPAAAPGVTVTVLPPTARLPSAPGLALGGTF